MDKNNLQELYYNLIVTPGVVRDFTNLLFIIGVDPVEILEFVPMQYLHMDKNIQHYEIPNNVTWIDNDAFAQCENLEIIVIPNTVNHIGNRVFSRCFSLKNIVYKGTINEWRKIQKGTNWDLGIPTSRIICNDGVHYE